MKSNLSTVSRYIAIQHPSESYKAKYLRAQCNQRRSGIGARRVSYWNNVMRRLLRRTVRTEYTFSPATPK